MVTSAKNLFNFLALNNMKICTNLKASSFITMKKNALNENFSIGIIPKIERHDI